MYYSTQIYLLSLENLKTNINIRNILCFKLSTTIAIVDENVST